MTVEVDDCCLAWLFLCFTCVIGSNHNKAWGIKKCEWKHYLQLMQKKRRSIKSFKIQKGSFTHVLLLGSSASLLLWVWTIGLKEDISTFLCSISISTFLCSISDLLLGVRRLVVNVPRRVFAFEEQIAHFERFGSGLTDLLLRNSWCLFSFSSFLICPESKSLVGLRHKVTLLRPRKRSWFSALISTFRSNSLSGERCVPLMVRASIAAPVASVLQWQ